MEQHLSIYLFLHKYNDFTTTLRPISKYNIGKTVVKHDKKCIKDLNVNIKDDSSIDYFIPKGSVPFSKGDYITEVNLIGKNLKIFGVPFMQQDPNVGSCASTSVWVAENILRERYKLFSFPVAKVTEQAVENTSGSQSILYSTSLTLSQISSALKRSGAKVRVINADKEKNLARELLYIYSESEIPVLCGLYCPKSNSGHIVTITGHWVSRNSLNYVDGLNKLILSDHNQNKIGLTGNHISIGQCFKFYNVHDDRYGPYARFDIIEEKEYTGDKRHLYNRFCIIHKTEYPGILVTIGKDRSTPYFIKTLIIPTPPFIYSKPENFLLESSRFYSKYFPNRNDIKFLFRTIVIPSNKFKEKIKQFSYSDKAVEIYRKMHLPKYICLIEISIANEIDLGDIKRKVISLFIYDASSTSYTTYPIIIQHQRSLYNNISSDFDPKCEINRIDLYPEGFLIPDSLPICFRVSDHDDENNEEENSSKNNPLGS